ncbi:non-hydrolyzing UDP-N-acetylglucosamine 2-epimerase [Polynucleobacter sp. AP-Feld-500C-C5]|uniref:non-hydrolyzing UDP-N-acetylglucosamine 2-epimerase n=1 Tax=Polynucleobacter sp. AP-Feld-500C-C5 TaxID=2576924 RepID=UPI001C0E64E6|nr:UDP-N-acetylglucosamine 2-epimerase (non-hydrolyzing) [Polynucleobacter sp. AP-Feld-500C-C5]
MKKNKIICVVGTRPEAIKMAPIILGLKSSPFFEVIVVATAQHRELLDGVFRDFAILADIDLNLMRPNQDLVELNAHLLLELSKVFESVRPDAVLAQGDTTTVFAASLVCFYKKIPFGHVEAGLRTGNFLSPFPEEMNRVFTSKISKWHFAPTQSACNNLISEGVLAQDIFIVGNSVIDSLLIKSRNKIELDSINLDPNKKLILVTVHRRENFGEPLVSICNAINEIVGSNDNVQVLISVHPNPNTKNTIQTYCSNSQRIILSDPLEYSQFVGVMNRAHIILSDSGGIQEEAPALGKPLLVLRKETERPESLKSGTVKLIGTEKNAIVTEVSKLLNDQDYYLSLAKKSYPYGDGNTSKAIVDILINYFQ